MANSTDDINKGSEEENFGLPDLEYKPLDQLETEAKKEEPVAETPSNTIQESPIYEDEEEESSNSGLIIALIVGLLILVGGFLAYQYVWKPKQARAEKERLAKLEADRKQKATADSLARVQEEERLKAEAAKANAKPAEGTIVTLTDRTGRYYVVISSSVDGDLAMDRAKKLSTEGKSPKIIPPFGKWKYYRLCLGDFDSFADAQSSADASKGEYGDALWVLKY